jgi:hypothetical protein
VDWNNLLITLLASGGAVVSIINMIGARVNQTTSITVKREKGKEEERQREKEASKVKASDSFLPDSYFGHPGIPDFRRGQGSGKNQGYQGI